MDNKVIMGEVPKSKEEQARLEEAMLLYNVINSITAKGCDAEVKRVKGKLKVQMIKKSESIFLN